MLDRKLNFSILTKRPPVINVFITCVFEDGLNIESRNFAGEVVNMHFHL